MTERGKSRSSRGKKPAARRVRGGSGTSAANAEARRRAAKRTAGSSETSARPTHRARKAPAVAEPDYTGTPEAMNAEQIARQLHEVAELLEILGENPFKVRAYENAARVLPGMGEELPTLIASGELERVRGIGRGIADKVVALAYTGRLDYFEELRARVPPGLLEMLRIPGLGPKKVKLLFDSLDIASVEALETACKTDGLKELRGFGPKTQESILRGIAYLRRVSARFFWSVAHAHAAPVLESLREHAAVQRVELAGSLRRRKETVHDVDIVASTEAAAVVTEHFASGPWVERVIGSGPTKSSILHPSGLQIDLRVVSDQQYPYALHHFTGSKAHNVAMRGRAQRMGIKINEYGLFRGEELIACETEAEIFAALGLQFVPPELREDEGEIAAAESGTLPARLLERADVQGAFHVHTDASDGRDSLEALVRAARDLGWRYIGISDHSQSSGDRGLSMDAALEQLESVKRLRSGLSGIRIFHGIESEVLEDGSLDYPDDVLRRFDFVIAAVHAHRELGRDAQTRRVVRAVENPHTTILGHPTGRLLFDQPALELDLGRVFEAAARCGVAVEINGQAKRMDPEGSLVRIGRDKGALFCVDPDAHDTGELRDVEQAVGLARRGWLGPEHVLNTWSADRVAEHLRTRRSRSEAS